MHWCSVQRISFEVNQISKEIRRAEHRYMNTRPPPPIKALVLPKYRKRIFDWKQF